MKTTRCLRLSALLLALLTAFGAAAAFAAQKPDTVPESALLYFTSFGRSRLIPDEDGVFTLKKQAAADVGEREHLLAQLWADEKAQPGETATVTFASKGYDFTDCVPLLIVPMDGSYYVKRLSECTAKAGSLSAEVHVGSLGVNSETPVYLYAAPLKAEQNAVVKLTLKRKKATQFDFGQVIQLGEYYIEKQGGYTPVEIVLGMANMDEDDIVYLVRDLAGEEVLRLVVHNGELYGLAKSENGLVVGLEYSFGAKAYVSAATGNEMLSKERVMDVFSQLGISFTMPPDEYDWLWRQKQYSMSRTIRIKGPGAQSADEAPAEKPEDTPDEKPEDTPDDMPEEEAGPAETDVADMPPPPEDIAEAEPDDPAPEEVPEPEEAGETIHPLPVD